MITRKIGKLLRGKTTPLQVYLACVLAGVLGFMPGFAQAAGLIVVLTLLLIILNANLFVAAIVGLLAKVVSLAAMPASFAAGRFLLDGPTQPLFERAINMPVLALFGFEYYVTTGGIVVGLIFGVVCGVVITTILRNFRRTMVKLENDSERFQKFTSKKSVRVATWIFLGKGHGKKVSYEDLLSKKIGNPIRVLGVVFAVLVVALLAIGRMFLTEPIVTAAMQKGLERVNGATVDLGSANLDLSAGSMTVESLAMADAAKLSTDLFRAARLQADVSGADLLRKRMTIDRLEITDAASGAERRFPGRVIGGGAEPTPDVSTLPGEKTIDDYLRDAEKYRERLAQLRKWLDKIAQRDPEAAPEKGMPQETLEDRLAREVATLGYKRVKASHLIEGSPTLLVREIVINGMIVTQLPDDVLNVHGTNLASQPWLVTEEANLNVNSQSGNLRAGLRLAAGGGATIDYEQKGISADAVSAMLLASPMQGGTMDLRIQGDLDGAFLDAPLTVTLHDTTLTIPGAGSQKVDLFTLPIGLRGPVDNPGIALDQNALADALVKAGANQLAGEVRGELQKEVDKVADKVGEQVGEEAKNVLGNILGGKKKEEEKPAETKPPGL